MSNPKNQLKILIAIALLFCVVIIGYNLFFVKEPSQTIIVMSSEAQSESESDSSDESDESTESDTESSEQKMININTATKEELKELDKIGDVIAIRIIDYREANGGFNSIEEIKNVSGIGDGIYEKIKDRIEV